MAKYEMNPDVCPSSLGEDGTPVDPMETAHKYYRGGKCEECGATREKAYACPLCEHHGVYHYCVNGTAVYNCEECPFLALEYYRDGNIKDLQDYLKLPVDL